MTYRFVLAALAFACVVTSAAAETGMASYYGGRHHGRLTASGERFNQKAMTCAHKSRAFGSVLTVTYRGNSIQCRVNDRGPFVRGRIVDVSVAGARALGLIGAGVGMVTVQ
jgi:rare lipoprotein A